MTTLGDIIYGGASGTPTALGIGSANQVLSVVGGIPAWTSAGSGDVTGPSSSTDGNFAVFNSTTGKIIMQSAAASLGSGAGGRATFNNGVDVGVSSSTTGTLVFRNSTNAGRTIIQASTSQAASDINYYWPIAQGTAGQILATDASGNLSWTAAGAGNVTTSGTSQVITGSIFFLSNLQVRDSGQTRNITLAAPTTGGTGSATITFPVLTGTVALLENTQTFTGAKTFSTATTTFNLAAATGSAITVSGTGNGTTPQINISGGTQAWISFSSLIAADPTFSTRATGTKVVLYPNIGVSTLDYGIGVGSAKTWISSGGTVNFYANNTVSSGQFQYDSSARGLNLNAVTDATASMPQLLITGSTTNALWMSFGGVGASQAVSAAPTLTTSRSVGTRIVLLNNFAASSSFDSAIGRESGYMWFCDPGGIRWYTNNSTTNRMQLDSSGLAFSDALNLVVGTGTGTKIGTTTSQKIAFWNKTPIVQPTTAITGAAFVQVNTTTLVSTASTFGGYTLDKVVAALINTGILA
jgi:hypothetical protein